MGNGVSEEFQFAFLCWSSFQWWRSFCISLSVNCLVGCLAHFSRSVLAFSFPVYRHSLQIRGISAFSVISFQVFPPSWPFVLLLYLFICLFIHLRLLDREDTAMNRVALRAARPWTAHRPSPSSPWVLCAMTPLPPLSDLPDSAQWRTGQVWLSLYLPPHAWYLMREGGDEWMNEWMNLVRIK